MADDVEREAFELAAAMIRRRREDEIARRNAHNATIDYSWLPERCPCCNMSWTLFHPARCETGSGFLSGEVRCVECKVVVWPNDWERITTAPEGVTIETKVDDARGVRNIQELRRDGPLWWFANRSAYVYYTPTHWRHVRKPA